MDAWGEHFSPFLVLVTVEGEGPADGDPSVHTFSGCEFVSNIMSQNVIPIGSCKNGYVYQIAARNSDCGVWIDSLNAFIIRRQKLSRIFLFPEYHWDHEHGTAKCLMELEKSPPYPWKEAALEVFHPKSELMLKYLEDMEKKYDIQFKRLVRYCLKFDRKARSKKKWFPDNLILGLCNNDNDLFDRVINFINEDRNKYPHGHDGTIAETAGLAPSYVKFNKKSIEK